MKGYITILALLYALNAVHARGMVVCYYASWAAHRDGDGKFTVHDIDPHLCTHLNYAFVGLNSRGLMTSLDPELDLAEDNGLDSFRHFTELKKKNTNLKLLASVGGWNEGSAKFSRMAASAATRKAFIESALVFIRKHGFDGLDISWLYPNQRDSEHHHDDINNFSVLLKELRVYFDPHGYLLSVAVTASDWGASQSYDVPDMVKHVHYLNLMTHDLQGPWDTALGYNAALYGNSVIGSLTTVEMAVNAWLKKGCPPEKLVLGVPFYAHTYTMQYWPDRGIGRPSLGPGIVGIYTEIPGAIGYSEFCQILQLGTEGWAIVRDGERAVPYATSELDWVSYDDRTSIREKVKFALKHRLAGIMVWSIDTDDLHNKCNQGKFPLLTIINNTLKQSVDNNTSLEIN